MGDVFNPCSAGVVEGCSSRVSPRKIYVGGVKSVWDEYSTQPLPNFYPESRLDGLRFGVWVLSVWVM